MIERIFASNLPLYRFKFSNLDLLLWSWRYLEAPKFHLNSRMIDFDLNHFAAYQLFKLFKLVWRPFIFVSYPNSVWSRLSIYQVRFIPWQTYSHPRAPSHPMLSILSIFLIPCPLFLLLSSLFAPLPNSCFLSDFSTLSCRRTWGSV